MTVHLFRSSSDGRKKGVALGGLVVPEEHEVPQGLYVFLLWLHTGQADPIYLTQRVSRGPSVPTLCEHETR